MERTIRTGRGTGIIQFPAHRLASKGDWTRQALSTARKQGYQYVIAGHDFDSSTTATVHTGTYTIPTSAGDITGAERAEGTRRPSQRQTHQQ